jgi:F-type H+-transporting ATPase subunit a
MPHLQRVRVPRARPAELRFPAAVYRRVFQLHQADADRRDLHGGRHRVLLGGFPQAPADTARCAEHRRDRHRDQILRPSLGKRGDTYLPFLVSLFFYIWLMNLMELIPVFQFPAMSRIGFVWPLVAFVYLLYMYLGFRHQGFPGYIKNMIPWDVPKGVLIILIPIELARFFIVQPFTLGVRLFANMFAGHLLLLIFTLATWYLASLSIGLLFAAGSFVMVFFVFALELLIDLLQAFIFTTLTAVYIASSLESAH